MAKYWIGQNLENKWDTDVACPTLDEYVKMVELKTSSFLHLANRQMQLFTKRDIDLYEFSNELGVYCQMKNDLCNLVCKKVNYICLI